MAYCESQPLPWLNLPQRYRVIDAALGIVEEGSWDVRECVSQQPWLPNGPVALQVDRTAPGYQRRSTLTSSSTAS